MSPPPFEASLLECSVDTPSQLVVHFTLPLNRLVDCALDTW